jgi:proline dehydrogenase
MATPSTVPAPPVAPISFEDTRIAFEAKSDAELRKMYALFAAMNNGSLVKAGSGLMQTALKISFPGTKFLIKNSIFKQFCGGETIQECRPVIAELGKYHIGTILDYSVEGTGNDKSFDRTRDEILATINMAASTPNIPFSVFKVTGLMPTVLLEKTQAGTALNEAEKAAFERGRQRLDALCASAHQPVCGCRGKLVSANHR